VLIKIVVTQIVNGLEYSAIITIAETTEFTCHLKFGVPIDELNDQEFPNDKEELMALSKRLFQFSMKKDESEIEISDEIFGFLVQVFGQIVLDFYNNEQIRDTNTGTLGQLLDKDSALRKITATELSISTTRSFRVVDIPPALKVYL
jgi:hypothetical protein